MKAHQVWKGGSVITQLFLQEFKCMLQIFEKLQNLQRAASTTLKFKTAKNEAR